jgi:hypothetical protein
MNRDPALIGAGTRLAERALVLTVVTLILLTPPILNIFNAPILVFGIPLLHVYCFGVWLVAVALGGWISTRMVADKPEGGRPEERG